jgi:hypothetical protein
MLEKNENQNTENTTVPESGLNEETPVISTYTLIKNDVWSAYHEFTTEYGVLCGLRDMNKEGNKDYKTAKARAIAFSVQFYGKVVNNFPKTFEAIKVKNAEMYDEERIKQYGDDVENYLELMRRITVGVPDKKGRFQRFSPNFAHLSLLLDFMSKFLTASGISHIEGRFQSEGDDMYKYGG